MPCKVLPIASIDLSFQREENLDPGTLETYAARLRAREKLEPVRVYSDGKQYWLADGFHRVAAAKLVGRKRITAEIVKGTLADLEAHWQEYMADLRKSLGGGS